MEHAVAGAAHAAGHGGGEASEIPNLLALLNEHFPHQPLFQFLFKWENVFFSLLVAFLISFVAIRAAHQKKQVPSGIQNFCEIVVEVFAGFVTGILGEKGRKHVPYVGTIFIYILLMNWSGLIPLLKSPTSAWSTTLALALTTMVYIQVTGIREQGFFHYIKHMAGNPINIFGYVLIPLMLALNIILEIGAAPFSLSLRLFANISSEDRLILNFAQMTLQSPFILLFQIFVNVLAILFSTIQAFVFTLLTTVYLALISPSHEGEDHSAENSHEKVVHEH